MIKACYVVFCLTLSILLGGVAYVTYGIISSKYKEWENTYLTDDNLIWAWFCPVLWFIYTYAMFHYFNEWTSRETQPDAWVLAEKLIIEIINLIATIITTMLLTGAFNKHK